MADGKAPLSFTGYGHAEHTADFLSSMIHQRRRAGAYPGASEPQGGVTMGFSNYRKFRNEKRENGDHMCQISVQL